MEKSSKSWGVTLVLSLIPITCIVGGPRWYTGPTSSALLRIIPFIGWIFGLIDLIKLLSGSYVDGEGKVVSRS